MSVTVPMKTRGLCPIAWPGGETREQLHAKAATPESGASNNVKAASGRITA
jgi:hypothetical protein